MIPAAVRSDKNRKRRMEEEKNADILETSKTLKLLHAIVETFNSIFPSLRVFESAKELNDNLYSFFHKISEGAEISNEDKKLLIAYGIKPFLVNFYSFLFDKISDTSQCLLH